MSKYLIQWSNVPHHHSFILANGYPKGKRKWWALPAYPSKIVAAKQQCLHNKAENTTPAKNTDRQKMKAAWRSQKKATQTPACPPPSPPPPQGQDLFWWVLENTQSEWKDPVYVIWLSWTSVLNISLSAKNEKAVKEHAGSLLSFSQYHKSRKYWTLLLLRVSCTVPSERHSSLMASFLECVQGIETEFLATIWFSTSWNPLHGLPSFQWSPKCTPKCHQNVTKMYTKESITRSFQFINDHQNVHQNEHQNVHQEHKFS